MFWFQKTTETSFRNEVWYVALHFCHERGRGAISNTLNTFWICQCSEWTLDLKIETLKMCYNYCWCQRGHFPRISLHLWIISPCWRTIECDFQASNALCLGACECSEFTACRLQRIGCLTLLCIFENWWKICLCLNIFNLVCRCESNHDKCSFL